MFIALTIFFNSPAGSPCKQDYYKAANENNFLHRVRSDNSGIKDRKNGVPVPIISAVDKRLLKENIVSQRFIIMKTAAVLRLF